MMLSGMHLESPQLNRMVRHLTSVPRPTARRITAIIPHASAEDLLETTSARAAARAAKRQSRKLQQQDEQQSTPAAATTAPAVPPSFLSSQTQEIPRSKRPKSITPKSLKTSASTSTAIDSQQQHTQADEQQAPVLTLEDEQRTLQKGITASTSQTRSSKQRMKQRSRASSPQQDDDDDDDIELDLEADDIAAVKAAVKDAVDQVKDVPDEDEDAFDDEEDKQQYGPVVLNEKDPFYVPVLSDEDLAEDPPGHRSGYVAIIGKPNAGKSTLINAIVGQKLSSVTFKAQTTRHRIVGIASEKDYQMILFDTPGIIERPRSLLEQRMMAAVVSSIKAAEAIIAVVDSSDSPEEALAMFQPGSNWSGPPMAVLLNKSDLLPAEQMEELVGWYRTHCKAQLVFAGSALSTANVAELKAWAAAKLPEGPTLYPKSQVSEQPERFFVSEIIREHIFLQYEQEVPYCTQVVISEFKERPGAKDYISASILVEKEGQKGIIVGQEGRALKRLGSSARRAIEEFLERPVYLELGVKAVGEWRSKKDSLKEYGYYDPMLI